ncbi:LysR family transcriptional regulator [Leptothrix sp. BB-4]
MFDIDSKTLRLLVAACDLRNMKEAAAQEHLEPSAISKRIAQLEERLGTPLLVRGRRGVHPTPAGEAVLEHARNVLFAIERMRTDVEAFTGGVRGQVTVAASASAIAEHLPDDLAAFMREPEFSQIRVVVEERFSRDVIRLVREGSAALGVCWDSVDFEGLEHLAYRSDELAVAVPVGHPLARRRRVRLADTLPFEHVGLPPAAAAHTMLARAAVQAGGQVNYRAIVSTFDASLRVVASGLALSIIPRVIVERARPQGVISIRLDEPWAQRRFAVAFRSPSALQPSAARLLDYLHRRAAEAEATA